jgi:hypothetical protein
MMADSEPQAPLPGLLLSERDLQIMHAVARYKFMRAEDICRLLFRPASLSYVRARLSRLCLGRDRAHRAYLCRFSVPSLKSGRPKAYCLGILGRHIIASDGIPLSASYRPGQTLSYSHLAHALTLSTLAVSAQRMTPGYTVTQLRLSYDIGRDPPTVEVKRDGKRVRVPVIPDGFAVFTRDRDRERFPTWIEVDRGSVPQARIKEGLRLRLRLLANGGYTAWCGLQSVCLLYVTTAGRARRQSLARWAQEVLTEEKRTEFSALFLFGHAAVDQLYEACPCCGSLPLFGHPILTGVDGREGHCLLPPSPECERSNTPWPF